MLFQDHYALHRHFYSGDVEREPVWTDWDFALANAVQIIDDFTTAEGHLVWEAESERVTFDALKKINKARAAIDRRTKGTKNKAYEASDGEYWTTEPVLMRGDEWPTMDEWVSEKVSKSS